MLDSTQNVVLRAYILACFLQNVVLQEKCFSSWSYTIQQFAGFFVIHTVTIHNHRNDKLRYACKPSFVTALQCFAMLCFVSKESPQTYFAKQSFATARARITTDTSQHYRYYTTITTITTIILLLLHKDRYCYTTLLYILRDSNTRLPIF